jgi:ribosome biogenesis GTPase
MMTLEELGYYSDLENHRKEYSLQGFATGRVISEHRERCIVKTESNEFEAEIIGNLRFTADARSGFPVVGDWVAILEYDENKALIHAIYPRKTVIERTAVGKFGEKQIIASNIDYALIMQAVDRDFNLNRTERYLAICYNAGVLPILLLNKTDLITDSALKGMLESVGIRIKGIPILAISNESRAGYEELMGHLSKGQTYCLLGSSGVGKSTLINHLTGSSMMTTDSISASTLKGKHITSHRELFILENGAIILDNPGMREVGIADSTGGLEVTFTHISGLSENCRFNNCTHTHESGCAVVKAVQEGEIDRDSYANYLKMLKEKQHFESNLAEKHKKEKSFGKIVKEYKRFKRRND